MIMARTVEAYTPGADDIEAAQVLDNIVEKFLLGRDVIGRRAGESMGVDLPAVNGESVGVM